MDGSEGCLTGLGGAMLAVAADPGRVANLHRLLDPCLHRFRNRLNCLKMSLYLAKRMEVGDRVGEWAELEERYRSLEQFLDQLKLFCGALSLQPVRASLGTLVQERRPSWQRWLSARGRVLELVEPKEAAVGQFDPTRLGQCLDTLAEWRSRAGPPETRVRVSWWAAREDLHLVWEEPGVSLQDGPIDRGQGPASLALPMIARVLAAHRGALEVAPRGGVRLELSWPIDLS